MKFAFKFSNLLGTVYHKGDLLFSPDGNSVLCPVGNRITIYDLKNNKSSTLPIESRFNFTKLSLSPNGCTLVAVNEEGEASLISMFSKMVVEKYPFKGRVHCLRFSPDGRYLAVCKDSKVFVFKAPGAHSGEYNPFVMERVFHDAYDETTCLDWTSDSRILAAGSKDMMTRLYGLEEFSNFGRSLLGGHSDAMVACFFERDSLDAATLSANGQLCVWECSVELGAVRPREGGAEAVPARKKARADSDSEDEVDASRGEEHGAPVAPVASDGDKTNEKGDRVYYKRLSRHYLLDAVKKQMGLRLTAAAYHKDTHILVTGFSTGAFFVHELPEVNLIHSLSIADQSISAVALNNTGDWIALGCSGLGQLLVWEWQSETYVLKQQGHFDNITGLAYSPDGQHIATGGEDGKVKVWNTSTGFCFVTFDKHTSGVSAVQFSRNCKFVISASLDGTVRAFDMTRYRNFRTFTSLRPVQFACVALDSTGEFVAAGGQDVFEIYLWSMKINRLLEVLCGHEGPVAGVAFSPAPASTALASVSWDKTLKLWNAVEKGGTHETVHLSADGLCVTYRPDGEVVAVATLDGQISFFDCKTTQQVGNIEGRNDLGSGRADTDLVTAKQSLKGKSFNSLAYTADGKCILAGGQSKNVCIYSIADAILIKKFEITQNRSFDAVDDFINRRKMTQYGNVDLVETRDADQGGGATIRLPGVRRGDMASRAFKPEVRVRCLQFSPTGQAWAAVTTEGLLVYSLDVSLVFDPFHLEVGITPDTIRSTLQRGDSAQALMMALKLNEKLLIQEVVENIPYGHVELTVRSLPETYAARALGFAASELGSTRHLEFYLHWVQCVLTAHGPRLQAARREQPAVLPLLHALHKNLAVRHDQLARICDFSKYNLQLVGRLADLRLRVDKEEAKSEASLDDVHMSSTDSE
ncbi:periodic tryptophan protein 2 homolog [Bacillus rossius redtenbacheri]|uniref:periodic tryptophan protein 2 homolog n=1 Tax=Bacillus rossius redtenbacheri TaxID=93214 RepID=UPI002FDD25EE